MPFFFSKDDKIYLLGIIITLVLLGIALAIFLGRDLVSQILLPIAASIISPDGVITPEGVSRFNTLLDWLRWIGLLGAVFTFTYVFILKFTSERLSAPVHSQKPKTHTVSRLTYSFLAAILFLALMLRLPHLTRGFYYDELFTTYHFIRAESWWGTISNFILFNNHIFFSILGRFSQVVFGTQEWAIRLPALILGLGSIFCLWLLIRSFAGDTVALASAFLMAISPTHVLWSVSARGYTGLIFFTLLSTMAFLSIIEKPAIGKTIIYTLASIAGIYTHLYAVWVVVGQFFVLFWMVVTSIFRNKSSLAIGKKTFRYLWVSFGAITLLSIVCYLPVLSQLFTAFSRHGGGAFQWQFPLTFIDLMAGNNMLLAVATFLLAMIGLLAIWRKYPLHALHIITISTIPFLISWLVMRPVNLDARFFSYLLPFYLFLVAFGFSSVWGWGSKFQFNGLKSGLFGFLVILAGFALFIWVSSSWLKIPEEAQYREAMQALTSQAEPDVTLCVFGSDADIFQFYTERSLIFPQSLSELGDLEASHKGLRCAYHAAPWNPDEYTRMANALRERSNIIEFKRMPVFVVR